ncbi:MAG TPA: hypothetical protein VH575_13045 [Gemmataceae bacterium]|jgi:hypothetical protein
MRRFHFLTAIVLLSGLAGCGGDGLKRVPVQGKLTSRGQPLDNTEVQFFPTGATPGEGGTGRSDDGGNFTLVSSRAGNTGITPGEYKVRVSRLVTADGKPLPADAKQADHPDARESIPGLYTSLENTPLTVKVPETGGEVPIDIPAKVLGRK